MEFRERLLATIRAIRPVFGEGVLIVGSQVPNLLGPGAPGSTIVSKDVDVGVVVTSHVRVKAALAELTGFGRAPDEPSVLVPLAGEMLEVNFVGIDTRLGDLAGSYALEDPELPLLVFGGLSFLLPGSTRSVGGVEITLPDLSGLLVEKLLTERSGPKGDRDLLVALGLLVAGEPPEESRTRELYAALGPEQRHQIRSNLTVLSLMHPLPEMPDPTRHRAIVVRLLRVLEAGEEARGRTA